MKHSIIAHIFITLLGIAFVLLGSFQIILSFVGKSTSAVITDIRREGGERIDGKPGRYTYNISYTFTLPDGKEINSFTKKIGDSVYLKADGSSTVAVHYFHGFPYINTIEQDTRLGTGKLVLILAGVFLILFINKR